MASRSNFFPGGIINFDLDPAWNEIKYLWKWVSGWSFSFTTYDMDIVNGHIVSTPVTNSINILDFVCSALVFTTLLDVLFWWKKSQSGELDSDDN